MKPITPHLWFNKEAKEAAELYTSLFENSKVVSVRTLHGTPSGDADIVSFALAGQPFMAISAGPYFTFNPSISLHVKCSTKEEVDKLWGALSEGGKVLMELGSYPFSERYGWLQDRYGLSWQIVYVGDQTIEQKIIPVLMFVGAVSGKAEEAITFYASVFKNASATVFARYAKGEEPNKEGTVKYASLTLDGQQFGAMDGGLIHDFAFNEAVSFIIHCETQEEVDYYWEKLSAVPESEQCGWLKDQYGVSWQVVPTAMDEMMAKATPEQMERVTKAFLQMKKFDIAELQKAYEG